MLSYIETTLNIQFCDLDHRRKSNRYTNLLTNPHIFHLEFSYSLVLVSLEKLLLANMPICRWARNWSIGEKQMYLRFFVRRILLFLASGLLSVAQNTYSQPEPMHTYISSLQLSSSIFMYQQSSIDTGLIWFLKISRRTVYTCVFLPCRYFLYWRRSPHR